MCPATGFGETTSVSWSSARWTLQTSRYGLLAVPAPVMTMSAVGLVPTVKTGPLTTKGLSCVPTPLTVIPPAPVTRQLHDPEAHPQRAMTVLLSAGSHGLGLHPWGDRFVTLGGRRTDLRLGGYRPGRCLLTG